MNPEYLSWKYNNFDILGSMYDRVQAAGFKVSYDAFCLYVYRNSTEA